MKLLGGSEDSGGARPQIRAQDDAAVGYMFQRHPNEAEFPQFIQKQSRWNGTDAIDVIIIIHIIFILVRNAFYSVRFCPHYQPPSDYQLEPFSRPKINQIPQNFHQFHRKKSLPFLINFQFQSEKRKEKKTFFHSVDIFFLTVFFSFLCFFAF
jgi:hypothetical protein